MFCPFTLVLPPLSLSHPPPLPSIVAVREHGLDEIATRLSVSLLRFVGLVPVDRAFFEAGVGCRSLKWLSMAFVFLNRYLDTTEAIEAADAGMIDNSDFVCTSLARGGGGAAVRVFACFLV